jgi:hypothetical protein
VYLGEQVLPAYFFIIGWAEGWRQSPQSLVDPRKKVDGAVVVKPKPAFRGVIA